MALLALAASACQAFSDNTPVPTATPSPPPTATPPPLTADSVIGFSSEPVVTGLAQPMDFAIAPDGRMLVATKEGAVRVVRDGVLLETPLVKVEVNTLGDRGLTAIALDPEFEENGYVYLYYTLDNDPAKPNGPKTGRLARFTADGDVAIPDSEVVLMGKDAGAPSAPSCQDLPAGADCLPMDGFAHFGGGLRFGEDGTLFLSTGDASQFTLDPDALRIRAQDLDSLAGKILRINPDGSAPSDNPFYDDDGSSNRSKVWAYGLRNPYRFAIQPGTGLPFIGDVGSDYWDEIDVATAGANFGWPCFEGAEEQPEQSQTSDCQEVLGSGAEFTNPLYAYPIDSGAAVIGGTFDEGEAYPPEFVGALFFGDWSRGTIDVLRADGEHELVEGSVHVVLSNGGKPVDVELGPDGLVYYLTLDDTTGLGDLRRLTHSPQSPATPPAPSSTPP
jgi:glucose/arabinose dehydrogenase